MKILVKNRRSKTNSEQNLNRKKSDDHAKKQNKVEIFIRFYKCLS